MSNIPSQALRESVKQGLLALMDACVELEASDLHLSQGLPPVYRIHGALQRSEAAALSTQCVDDMAISLLDDESVESFLHNKTLDFGVTSPKGNRFRINIYREQGRSALAIRYLEATLKTTRELGLPPQLDYLAGLPSGLVLVCGATGSGKSTTLAALLNTINESQEKHILTVEDPIEIVHQNKKSIVHQRELHTDVPDFASAVRAALREDPDVVMVGEMRDLETVRSAITAAETGHLVFSTLHTNDAVGVVERLIGTFPGDEQSVARQRIAQALKAVVAQTLVPVSGGRGRAVIAEVLMVNTAVANLIETAKSKQIYSVMESCSGEGMQTFDQALSVLVRDKLLDLANARALCRDRTSFEQMLARQGALKSRTSIANGSRGLSQGVRSKASKAGLSNDGKVRR